jgi:uncharacterized protein YnzC (UPF0291/DUF896 family)
MRDKHMNQDEMTMLIARINELARKAKRSVLTNEEIAERNQLRQRYLEIFRTSLKRELDTIEFTD